VSRREVAVVIGAIVASILLLLALGGGVLWTRPFWMDEVAMFFLTGESVPRMLDLVARGADWNPPTLHLLVWFTMRAVGLEQLTPVFLHSFALLFVAGALCFAYFTLRRRFGPLPSAAGVLAMTAQGLVVMHAFEGRFYGPWLFFAAAFVWVLGSDAGRPSRRRDVALAIVSVFLCSIHWYGIFSLGLIAVGVLIAWRATPRQGVRLLLPAAAGVATLALLVPIALSQRASAAPVLWVYPLNTGQVREMAGVFIPGAFVVVLALLAVVDAVIGKPLAVEPSSSESRADAGIAGLLALGAMPLVLIALSVVLTPSMVSRYAIVAAGSWAVVVAALAHRWSTPLRWATVGTFAILTAVAVGGHIQEQRAFVQGVELNARAFRRAKADSVPVIFQRLHVIYPVAGTERGPATPARYIDIPDSTYDGMYPQPEAARLKASLMLDRDQARYHAGLYGWPVMAPVASLDTTSRFYIVAMDATLPPGYAPMAAYAARLFPRHRVTRLGPALSLLELQASPGVTRTQ
jgi:hypothetical protein